MRNFADFSAFNAGIPTYLTTQNCLRQKFEILTRHKPSFEDRHIASI